MMKKKVRYPLLKIGMVIGIVIAYLSFAYAGKMVREEYLERQDVENYREEMNTLGVLLHYEGDGADILHAMDDETVTEYISLVPLYADNEEGACLMNVYLHLPDPFPYHVKGGIIPTKEALTDGERVIVLGAGLKSGTIHKEDGDYYKVCGEEYRVIAYVNSETSNSLDHARILFYDFLGEKAKADIDYHNLTMGGLNLVLRSDTVDLNEFLKEKKQILDDRMVEISGSEIDTEDNFSIDNDLLQYQKFAYLLYLFSVVLIVAVIELWIVERKKEFAIRRAVGYSRSQIIKMISSELIKIIVGTGGILLLIQFLIQMVFLREMSRTWSHDIVLCMGFIGLTFVMLMIYPVYKIMTDGIAATIQDKGV